MRRFAWIPFLFAAAAFAAGDGGHDFRFASLNRTYTDLATSFAPIEQDPVRVDLSSPSQTLIVKDHRIHLVPQADGTYLGTLDVDFQGKGQLIADVDLAGFTRHLADVVVVPPQHSTVSGRVRIARQAGGYRITAVELPKQVTVAIESRVASDVVAACDKASLLTLGSLDCSPLERSLTRPEIPLPAPGQEYFLADSELPAAERAELDAFLAASAPAPATAPAGR